MPFIVCESCKTLPPEVCEASGTCERCGADLLARAEAKRAMQFHRSKAYTAHPLEDEFMSSLFIAGESALLHDAWNLLDYVEGQLSAIQKIIAAASETNWETIGIVGFMTGSIDLIWLLRELIGHKLPQRVWLTGGLAHKINKSDPTPDNDFFAILDQYRDLGVTRLFIVDEVVGGTQVRTALSRVGTWSEETAANTMDVHVLGLTEVPPDKHAELRKVILKGYDWATLSLIPVPELLAKDGKGTPIKPAIKIGTKYIPYRYWPGSYEVRCANTLTSCSFRQVIATHTGSAYASTVRAICTKQSTLPPVCWPEKHCADCGERLERVRRVAATLPNPYEQEGVIVGKVTKGIRKGGIWCDSREFSI